MAAAGQQQTVRAEDVAHMGITEVLLHAPFIFRQYRKLVASLKKQRPDVAVLIDFPDVNFRLAKHLRRAGVPVVWFVSPQLWAWKRRRLRWVQQRVDKMLVIFPFEETLLPRARRRRRVRRPSARRSSRSRTPSREEYAAAAQPRPRQDLDRAAPRQPLEGDPRQPARAARARHERPHRRCRGQHHLRRHTTMHSPPTPPRTRATSSCCPSPPPSTARRLDQLTSPSSTPSTCATSAPRPHTPAPHPGSRRPRGPAPRPRLGRRQRHRDRAGGHRRQPVRGGLPRLRADLRAGEEARPVPRRAAAHARPGRQPARRDGQPHRRPPHRPRAAAGGFTAANVASALAPLLADCPQRDAQIAALAEVRTRLLAPGTASAPASPIDRVAQTVSVPAGRTEVSPKP